MLLKKPADAAVRGCHGTAEAARRPQISGKESLLRLIWTGPPDVRREVKERQWSPHSKGCNLSMTVNYSIIHYNQSS